MGRMNEAPYPKVDEELLFLLDRTCSNRSIVEICTDKHLHRKATYVVRHSKL